MAGHGSEPRHEAEKVRCRLQDERVETMHRQSTHIQVSPAPAGSCAAASLTEPLHGLCHTVTINSMDEPRWRLGEFLAWDQVWESLIREAKKVAWYEAPILIEGETGTGKELFARGIKEESQRPKGPFVAKNCGAMPENLADSELFGHRKGTFTGATEDRTGLFEEASRGTLFLDEIGDLPLTLQVKLLRVLQEGEIRRLGDSQDIKVDVRVICATNRVLATEIAAGRFREDLYYRLNVIPLRLPPLRERREDIPLLVDHFRRKFSAEHRRQVTGVEPEAMQALMAYHFPGNVRELENLIERAVILASGDRLTIDAFPNLGGLSAAAPSLTSVPAGFYPEGGSLKKERRKFEHYYLDRMLREHGSGIGAARAMGMSVNTFYVRCRTLGVKFPKTGTGK
jgi:two-component system, NtrC family, response regulator AtoC